MKRSKRIILTTNCILNQNMVIENWERAAGSFSFVNQIIEADVGIFQLPCPEFIHYGPKRPSMTYSEYDTVEHRHLCRQLLLPVIQQLRAYQQANYKIIGILGINDSPNCSISGQRGVFMEIFWELLAKENYVIPYLEVPSQWNEETHNCFIHSLTQLLQKKEVNPYEK